MRFQGRDKTQFQCCQGVACSCSILPRRESNGRCHSTTCLLESQCYKEAWTSVRSTNRYCTFENGFPLYKSKKERWLPKLITRKNKYKHNYIKTTCFILNTTIAKEYLSIIEAITKHTQTTLFVKILFQGESASHAKRLCMQKQRG